MFDRLCEFNDCFQSPKKKKHATSAHHRGQCATNASCRILANEFDQVRLCVADKPNGTVYGE
jgi:hypothetical protein